MLKFKRVFLMLLLMLLLVAAAYAEETTAPAATPEPIRQYSISDVLSRGMYLLDSTDPAATDYVLRIGPKSHELCLSLRPAKEHRIDASAVMTAGEESVVLAVQLSQDAVYIDLDGDAIAVRYADLIDVISSFERLPGFEEEKIMSSSDALASLLEELSQEFVDGAFSIRESGSSFYFSTGLMQILQTLSRCGDRLVQEEALISNLFACYVHPFIPDALSAYKEVLSADGIIRMLDHVRSIVQHEPADFLVNFSLNRDESSSCARYIGTANLRFPLDGGVSLFFSAEESENSSCFELEGEISCFNFEETVLVLDIKGDISEKFASLRIIPRGYESNTVTANLSYENAFSFLLDTPVGTLTIEADPSFYMPSFAIRASGFGFSLDGKFSRYLFYTPSMHVGLRYPSFPPSSAGMKYDYVTLEPDGTLQVRYGRSLLTSRVVSNTNNNGIRNVTALTFDRDVASTGDTRCGLLTTSIRQILNSIRISQVLEENNETYELWSLEASPSIQPVDAIADAQVLDAQFLRALPDRIIRYFAQESAAAQPDGKESISVQ